MNLNQILGTHASTASSTPELADRQSARTKSSSITHRNQNRTGILLGGQIKRRLFKGFLFSCGLTLGLFATVLAALTIVSSWSAGENLSASKLNLMVTAISELQGAVGYDSGLGGYRYVLVDGVKTKVYTKYLTGSLPAAATHVIPHGITDHSRILAMQVVVQASVPNSYTVTEYRAAEAPDYTHDVYYDATNIGFQDLGVKKQSQPYRIKIEYIE
ncbi:MAG: hypothetical protein KDK39_15280 [Leptospiraceae bacterium]|nr:hypothetical protein [Leptospiraceae bacterium]